MQASHYTIGGLKIEKLAASEPCLRLVQFGKGQPITCRCKKYCEARNQTPDEARASVAKSLGIAL